MMIKNMFGNDEDAVTAVDHNMKNFEMMPAKSCTNLTEEKTIKSKRLQRVDSVEFKNSLDRIEANHIQMARLMHNNIKVARMRAFRKKEKDPLKQPI